MKIEIVRKIPEPPPIEKVILETTPEEIRALRAFAIFACNCSTKPETILAARRFLKMTDDDFSLVELNWSVFGV